MDEEYKRRFLQIYSNLPINERKNVIVIIESENNKKEKKPISWDIAYLEVDKETKLGEIILKKLIKLNMI